MTADIICGDKLTHNEKRHIAELEVCKRVLENRIQILGENHPDTLRSISNMFFLYTQLGNAEAFLRYKEVFDLKMTSRERLEKKIANQRALNAEIRAEDLQQKYIQAQQDLDIQRISSERLQEEIVNLQHRLAQEPLEQVRLVLITEDSVTHEAGSQSSIVQSQLPPPPPPIPPAPPLASMRIAAPQKADVTKKNVPKPSVPLKIFNWVKLPDTNLQGTVWAELDFSKWYERMDFKSIDKLFSAFQLPNDGSSIELKNRTKNRSVIDGQRAQNGAIMLRKLKMNGKEISKAILSMDSNEELSIDKLELLLKFTPSDEERALLEKHSENVDSLDSADRFLYEISKIHNYEQQLKNLLFKKKFKMTVDDISQKIANVKEASREVANSVRLKKLLELVLAFGNYMSRGSNQCASGFRLVSLNRLADTKSTVKEITLLHYLIQVIEKQVKDFVELDEDLSHVRLACKVLLTDTVDGITQLRTGLVDFCRDISDQSADGQPQPDRFFPVMSEFHSQASKRFAELEDQFQDMKTCFDKTIRLFREDESVQPDKFFEIFDVFLTALMKARQDNDNLKKRQEQEERRANQKAEHQKPTIERKNIKSFMSSVAKSFGVKSDSKTDAKEECDDLESTFRFGERMSYLKRLRKPRLGGTNDARNTSMPQQRFHRAESRERDVVGHTQ